MNNMDKEVQGRNGLNGDQGDCSPQSDQGQWTSQGGTTARSEPVAAATQARTRWYVQQILVMLIGREGATHGRHSRRPQRPGIWNWLFGSAEHRATRTTGTAAITRTRDDEAHAEDREATAARDLCIALRWHRANIASTLPAIDENDAERRGELRDYVTALDRARETVVAYYDLPLADAVEEDAYPLGSPPILAR